MLAAAAAGLIGPGGGCDGPASGAACTEGADEGTEGCAKDDGAFAAATAPAGGVSVRVAHAASASKVATETEARIGPSAETYRRSGRGTVTTTDDRNATSVASLHRREKNRETTALGQLVHTESPKDRTRARTAPFGIESRPEPEVQEGSRSDGRAAGDWTSITSAPRRGVPGREASDREATRRVANAIRWRGPFCACRAGRTRSSLPRDAT
jgi:hypothetical protein